MFQFEFRSIYLLIIISEEIYIRACQDFYLLKTPPDLSWDELI